MTRPLRRSLLVPLAVAALAAAASTPGQADAADRADAGATDPTFTRHDVDTAVSGASFTSVGEVFAGEQDIVTSGYGVLDSLGRPTAGGTLQVYRPDGGLGSWRKVPVFDESAGLVFPNAPTIVDVDGDDDHDLLVPSGYFFSTDPEVPEEDRFESGAITWWENAGGDDFVRHDVTTGQPGSYHGVQLVDLDGDGIRDLLSVSEQANTPGDLYDDDVATQFFKGNADLTFQAPVDLTDNLGGSQPVVHDVDGDGDLDVISSQYFHTHNGGAGAGTFLWLENTDRDGTLTAADFTAHTIATLGDTTKTRGVGMGFQIRPVPGFRGPGTVSWIGTNHVNRCTYKGALPVREQVLEFTPGADPRKPWRLTTLSDPVVTPQACPVDYFDKPKYPVFSDAITARYGYGQGAPGVLGYGDIDGDGDVDLAISGDGDRRLWWIEMLADGETRLHQLTADGEYFGQSGGAAVVDLDGDGTNELVFSSFDQNTVAIWSPTGTTTAPTVVDTRLTVSPDSRTVKAGASASWKLRLTGAKGVTKRTVSVVFDPKKGADKTLRSVTLRGSGGTTTGTLTWKPTASGTIRISYGGTRASALLLDRSTQASARVKVVKKRK